MEHTSQMPLEGIRVIDLTIWVQRGDPCSQGEGSGVVDPALELKPGKQLASLGMPPPRGITLGDD